MESEGRSGRLGGVVAHGSVLRIVLSIPMGGTQAAMSFATIASAFEERTDPNALVIGPTGLSRCLIR